MSAAEHSAEPPRPTSHVDLRDTLTDAVDLLRSLPRDRAEVTRARDLVQRWAAGRTTRPVLVVDERPGTTEVDYDLLLEHPDGGSVAVNVQLEDGVPWTVDHATHWAAGHLLTIDGLHSVSVPEALMALRSLGGRDTAMHELLVDHRLLLTEVAADREPVSTQERQSAADAFRRTNGLHTREATLAWLGEINMPLRVFDLHLETMARIRRFRAAKEAELGPGYLAAHRDDFAVLHGVWVLCTDRDPAQQLAGTEPAGLVAAAERLLDQGLRIELHVLRGLATELPGPLQQAEPGEVVGPVAEVGRHLVGAVLSRTPSEDGPELAAAGRAAVAEWLRERRAEADVRWHWV